MDTDQAFAKAPPPCPDCMNAHRFDPRPPCPDCGRCGPPEAGVIAVTCRHADGCPRKPADEPSAGSLPPPHLPEPHGSIVDLVHDLPILNDGKPLSDLRRIAAEHGLDPDMGGPLGPEGRAFLTATPIRCATSPAPLTRDQRARIAEQTVVPLEAVSVALLAGVQAPGMGGFDANGSPVDHPDPDAGEVRDVVASGALDAAMLRTLSRIVELAQARARIRHLESANTEIRQTCKALLALLGGEADVGPGFPWERIRTAIVREDRRANPDGTTHRIALLLSAPDGATITDLRRS